MNFGQRLLDILEDRDMTRADLCRLTGLKSSNLVPYIKNPDASPKLSTAVKIADALDVSLDYLAGRTEKKAIRYEDAETQRLADGFSQLNRDGRSAIKEQLDFQLAKNAKNEGIRDDKISGVA
ncbi:helix-turn-helix domain-containing protein [Paraeggerthella sp. LCP19S3_G8]|uniref:helix-turn-helix domain-containing protein n=1 Tax=Paraeggerthella sp. LCP19S3_G8 TaxID=3440248 RepID=UPI002A8B3A7C|nr:helix-turn-helix transcriptional regulator [Paraeggerthella sp.]